MVDQLPKVVKGNVKTLLSSVDERGLFDEIVEDLDLKNVLERDMGNLSGGELQRKEQKIWDLIEEKRQ